MNNFILFHITGPTLADFVKIFNLSSLGQLKKKKKNRKAAAVKETVRLPR